MQTPQEIAGQLAELLQLAEQVRISGRHDQAESILITVNGLVPDSPAVARGLGLIACARGDWETGAERLKHAVDGGLEDSESWNALGAARNALGLTEAASAAFSRALALNPVDPAILINQANTLRQLGRSDDALPLLDRAAAVDPSSALVHFSRGNLLLEQMRHAEAVDAYGASLTLDPNQPQARLNRAHARLMIGDFEKGWADYEARKDIPGALGPARPLDIPPWLGEPDLAGKTILLHCEQGMGDALQFIRYASLVAACGARVVLESFEALAGLLATAPGVDQVITRRDPLPPCDVHCPLMSLPLALGVTEPLPAPEPYVFPDRLKTQAWKGRFPERLRIGIANAGNPAQARDRYRSIPLDVLADALPLGPAYVLLQKTLREGEQEVLAGRPDIAFAGPDMRDFTDSAAATAAMDLVISICSAPAHLAGALHKPLWVLLAHPADWRLGMEGDTSAWYPTARLYRQTTGGDWSGPLARITAGLQAMIAQSHVCGATGVRDRSTTTIPR
jgi:Flp pilus assembly protein TadD